MTALTTQLLMFQVDGMLTWLIWV